MSTTAKRRILVVCSANRCRSPIAEGLIRERIRREGLAGRLDVRSAGTWTTDGLGPTEAAVAVMSERGIDISDVRSHEITADDVAEADLILTMEEGHLIAIETEFAAARGKARQISTLAGRSWDIRDPVGGGTEEYETAVRELTRLIEAGWREIVGDVAPSGARRGV